MTTATPKSTSRKPRRMARPPELAPTIDVADAVIADPAAAGRTTKASIVLDLLRREEGALLADIVEATGWQPHTSRAALTGLKKKGHTIVSNKVDKVTCYKLV